MKKIIIILALACGLTTQAQVGIGTGSPATNAALQVDATDKGVLIPRLTKTERVAITAPANGLLVYQTDNPAGFPSGFWYYDAANNPTPAWKQWTGGAWSTTGNAATDVTLHKLGTTDAKDLVIKTKNVENMRLTNLNSRVGIGTFAPATKFHINRPNSTPTLDVTFTASTALDAFDDKTNWATDMDLNGNFFGMSNNLSAAQQPATLIKTVTLAAATMLTFRYATQSEPGETEDYLRFYLDNVLQAQWSGNTPWNSYSIMVPAGTHQLKWTFEKDADMTSIDRGFLDDILLADRSFRLEDGNEANGHVLVSDVNGNATWKDPATVIIIDDDWRSTVRPYGISKTEPIYHKGAVALRWGTANAPRAGLLLDISRGASDGARIGIGSDECMTDPAANEISFTHSIVPKTDNSASLGDGSYRWSAVYATNGTINTSDQREKEAIHPLNYGIAQLKQLRPVAYQWKTEQYGNKVLTEREKRFNLGFIAQELQQVLPEVVKSSEWKVKTPGSSPTFEKKNLETLGVYYSDILPVVVKATQEHQTTLDEIKQLLQETSQLLQP